MNKVILLCLIVLFTCFSCSLNKDNEISNLNLQTNTINNRIYLYGEHDSFPEVCSVYYLNFDFPNFSGVLIGEKTVLTAAHCIINKPVPNHVKFGTQIIKVKCSLTHPSYISFPKRADLAILILEEKVKIKPARLNKIKLDYYYRGIPLYIVGFSHIIKTVNKENTVDLYGTLEGTDSLRWIAFKHSLKPGDSGGGVFTGFGGQKYLLGINSSVGYNPLTLDDIDSTATRVDLYVNWIEECLLIYE